MTSVAFFCYVIRKAAPYSLKTSKDIVNKRRCWHVDYDDMPQFHMGLVRVYGKQSFLLHQVVFDRCTKRHERLYQNYVREHRLVVMQADVEKVKRRKVKTS